MMTRLNLFWVFLLSLAAFSLYLVKYQVQSLEDELVQVQESIASEKQAIHVLNAEWDYLNRPQRLQALAENKLGMEPTLSEHVMDLGAIPYPPQSEDNEPVAPHGYNGYFLPSSYQQTGQ